MSIYTTTYLYIKQHTITGKLYFGKTTRNPETYKGSGLYWKRHLKIHGKEHVVNLWYCLFLDQESCTEFAYNFSKQHKIVDSDDWLNLKPENGLDGNPKGFKFTDESKRKMHDSKIGKKLSTEHKVNLSLARKGKSKSGRIIYMDGMTFNSIRQAAEYFKVSTNTIYYCIEKGRLPNQRHPNYGKPQSQETIEKLSKSRIGLVACFNLETGESKKIPRDEFIKFKDIKYVGLNSPLRIVTRKIS